MSDIDPSEIMETLQEALGPEYQAKLEKEMDDLVDKLVKKSIVHLNLYGTVYLDESFKRRYDSLTLHSSHLEDQHDTPDRP